MSRSRRRSLDADQDILVSSMLNIINVVIYVCVYNIVKRFCTCGKNRISPSKFMYPGSLNPNQAYKRRHHGCIQTIQIMAARHVLLVLYFVDILVSEDCLYDKNLRESC